MSKDDYNKRAAWFVQLQEGLNWKRMAIGRHLGVAAVALWAVTGWAQSAPPNPAPCTVAPQPAPCGSANAPASKPSTAEKFPFPEEPSAPAPPAVSAPAPPPAAASPDAPAGAKKDFPFPGEDAKPAASGGESSSSSSSGDDPAPADPDAAGLKDKGSEGSQAPQGRHLLHRVNPIGTKLQSPEEREAEDLDVAHYYTQTGDLKGALLRTQDAVKLAPDDPDAHFALAETARKLNKLDVAIAEYGACLKLDPDDKEAKAARKELARLKP